MPARSLAPTKSNLLTLKRQLSFAEDGYGLLEQKRQLLVFELMRRLDQLRTLEAKLEHEISEAHRALREAELDAGTDAVERAAPTVSAGYELRISEQSLMGIATPRVALIAAEARRRPGVDGTPASLDLAVDRFTALVPMVAELAEIGTAVARLAEELRKTQRRCNALSRVFIPRFRSGASYIAGALEERERESLVILKMVRDRLACARGR